MGRSTSPPLARRLIATYLLFGTAGVVGMCALAWTARSQLAMELTAPAVSGALFLLLVGCFVLRRALGLTPQIELQLQEAALATSPTGEMTLEALPETNSIGAGWNRLLERAANHETLQKLEGRLSQTLGGLKGRKAEQIVNSLPDGIAVTDASGTITLSNRALVALLHAKEGEVEGGKLIDLLGLDKVQGGEAIRRQIAQQNKPLVFSLQRSAQMADGVLRVARYPMSGDDRTVSHVWSIRDITQQKLADEMRNQFVYSATHELRTPLANIKAYAETLSLNDDIDVERQKQFCNIINTEATRLARFVDELLNISQMEAGALTLSRHETDLQRLVEEVIEKVQPQMTQKRLEFQANLPPKFPKLTLDKDKIAASLVNILGNAAKYTPEAGRVGFTVEVHEDEIRFTVEDSGIGISPEELNKVFDKFFRSGDPRVREITGSGLGLSFTQEVVRLHGGRLTATSEINKGSRFTMTLPRNKAEF